jgi:hypothetical protein
MSGSFAFTAIGETTQLTATASLSDNTTKDVTGDGIWQVGDSRYVSVSSSGLLTVTSYGSTWVGFSYAGKGAQSTVTATPAGTFIISGRVREPGQGGVPDATVVDTLSGRTSTADIFGQFSLAVLPSLRARIKVAVPGFEPAELETTQPTAVDIPVQQTVRLTAGDKVTPHPLAPNDLSYVVNGERCNDCRLIRVVATRTGSLRVHVTWSQSTLLRLFVQGQVVDGGTGDLVADTQISSTGEVLMYLGVQPLSSANHTAFTLETSWN